MKIRKLTSYLLAGMIATTIISPKMAFAEETTQNVQASANIENKVTIAAKERVSVHDPSIVKDGNEYYVFGYHIEAAKSK